MAEVGTRAKGKDSEDRRMVVCFFFFFVTIGCCGIKERGGEERGWLSRQHSKVPGYSF